MWHTKFVLYTLYYDFWFRLRVVSFCFLLESINDVVPWVPCRLRSYEWGIPEESSVSLESFPKFIWTEPMWTLFDSLKKSSSHNSKGLFNRQDFLFADMVTSHFDTGIIIMIFSWIGNCFLINITVSVDTWFYTQLFFSLPATTHWTNNLYHFMFLSLPFSTVWHIPVDKDRDLPLRSPMLDTQACILKTRLFSLMRKKFHNP